MDEVKVQVTFTIEGYTDSLYYGLAEYLAKTPEQLEADKQARYDAWQYAINNPPVYEEE